MSEAAPKTKKERTPEEVAELHRKFGWVVAAIAFLGPIGYVINSETPKTGDTISIDSQKLDSIRMIVDQAKRDSGSYTIYREGQEFSAKYQDGAILLTLSGANTNPDKPGYYQNLKIGENGIFAYTDPETVLYSGPEGTLITDGGEHSTVADINKTSSAILTKKVNPLLQVFIDHLRESAERAQEKK